MQFWIIQGLNSLSLGGLLFLLSSGFSLIFGLMRLANLTHGAFFMLGTYFGATALRSFDGLNIWVTAIGAGIAVAAIGGLFERLVLTRLKTNPLGQVLVTLGMSFIISDACLVLGEAIRSRCRRRKTCSRRHGSLVLCFRLIGWCWWDAPLVPRSCCISCWSERAWVP